MTNMTFNQIIPTSVQQISKADQTTASKPLIMYVSYSKFPSK